MAIIRGSSTGDDLFGTAENDKITGRGRGRHPDRDATATTACLAAPTTT